MKKKEDLRKIKTRASLYRGFMKLLKDNSFEDINISDICKTASINRSTFYDHFDDKDKLLQGFISDMQNELEISLTTSVEYNDIKEYYMEIINILLNHIDKKLMIYKTVINIKCNSYVNDMFTQLLLNTTIDEVNKNFTNKTDIPTDILLLFYISGITSVIVDEISNPQGFNKDKIYTIINNLFRINELKKSKRTNS